MSILVHAKWFWFFAQLLSCIYLFVSPWTAAWHAPLSSTISKSLLKFMFTELVMLSNHLIFCHLLIVLQFSPESGSFPMSQLFISGGQSIGASASASVLPMKIQGWFPWGSTSLISLQSKGFSNVFSSTVWKHPFFGASPFLWSNSLICRWVLGKP